MAKACLPDDIYGPKQQTIFLGSSVQSVSCSLGWNEQQSSLTVVLVDDFCEVPTDKPAKVYYPKPGSRVETREADPGFTKPTIGVPVYFRIGGELGSSSDIFEFAGIIQSWTEDRSSGGYPVYTVQIVDPRLILQNLEIIVSDYAGGVGDVYNLINAYGWLESEGSSCPQTLVNGANFGSPAGGFCGAENNNEGTPWNKPSGPGGLRYAIQRLLSGNSHGSFSPYGYASYRGPDPNTDKAPNGEYYGVIEGSSADRSDAGLAAAGGHKYVSQYYIDISEIPFTPTFYRIPGPSISLLDLITQVCNDSGSDYYIELLITSTKQKCIKVRTVQRAVQPTLGEIESFVQDVENVTSKNIGRELRNEPSQAFVYGGYVQSIYQQDRTATKSPGEIIQFWGYDAAGALTYASNTVLSGREVGEWAVWLDIRPLNLVLQNTLTGSASPGFGVGNNYLKITEREIRLALAGFDPWFNFALTYKAGVGTEFGKQVRSVLDIVGPQIDFGTIDQTREDIKINFSNMLGFNLAFQPDQDPQNPKNGDMRKIHDFIQNWADTYYGKKFLVQLPYVCYCTDADSGQVLYSDNPVNDGGWPAFGVTNILGLPVNSTEGIPGEACSHFTDDSNKVLPFLRFYNNGTGAIRTEGDSLVYNPGDLGGNSLYVSSSVEEKPLEYYSYATAIVNLDNPIEMSGLEKDLSDIDVSFGGLIEIAHQSGLTSAQIGDLKFGLSFNPDGSRGADGALGMALRRRTPDEAAVPMKSNTTRYGPKAYKGPPGQIHFVADDGLVPWEYDGYTNLQNGGINAMDEQASSAVTYMQEGERGSVNFPGHPTKRLGSELRSSQSVMGLLNMQSADFEVSSKTFQFNKINLGTWEGSFGPNITNIQINIGDNGFTSNYTLSTFSPTFGRFAKYNANRLKIMGKQRQSFRKAQRERNKLARALRAAQERTSRSLKDANNKRKNKADAPNSNTVKAGQMGQGNATNGNTTAGANVSDTSLRTLRMGNTTDWVDQAIVSNDAFYRPVWNGISPSSRLPRYTKTANGRAHKPDLCWEERPHQTRHVNPPFNGAGSGPSSNPYKPCIIDNDYLDPYAYPSKVKHDASGNLAGNYTDISVIAHGSVPAGAQYMNAYVDAGNSFPEHLRMMASKGPMLMHGWGFDIDGKPIPNEADTESAASGGTFVAEDLKDRFLTHYLRKPHTWPVGPIDLRFDRARGVWTQPMQYKIVQASTTGGGIAAGQSRTDVQVLDMGTTENPVYDANGAVIPNTSGTIKVTNPSWSDTIASGDGFFAVYDSIACTYYPLVGGGSGGETTFYNTGVCYDSSSAGCQAPSDRGCWTSSTIVVGSGLQASQIPVSANSECDSFPSGTGTFLSLRVPVYDVGSTGSAGSSDMSVISGIGDDCVSDWGTLIFGSGMSVYTGGREDKDGQDCNFVYIEASGAGGETTFYNTGVCYDSAGTCTAPSDRGCWTSSTIIAGSGLQAAHVPINANGDCDSVAETGGTFLSLRVPVYDVGSTGSAGSSDMSVIKELESNCISDWSTLVFGSGITAYTGGRSDQTNPTQDCNFVYIEASGGSETTFYNTGVCYDSAGTCTAPSDRGCWTNNTIVVGSGLQAAQVPINANGDCDSLAGTGTFLSLRVPVYDVDNTGSAGSTSRSVIKKLESSCISDWSTLVFGSGITAYTGGRSDQTNPTQDCNFVYIEASGGGSSCSQKNFNVTCASAKDDWCGDVASSAMKVSDGSLSACSGLIAGPGLFMYDITGAKSIGSTSVSGYQYIETALIAGLGCAPHTAGYVHGLEKINLGCGLSGTGATTCSASADEGGGGNICDWTVNVTNKCYNSVGSVSVIGDVCCSGGSGLVIVYKTLRFTDCGLFTGVIPYTDCAGTHQPGEWL